MFLHGLEMCMWFGCNAWINFCHFFHFVNFVIFWPQIRWKYIDSGYHVSATHIQLCTSFFHGLKMCMWFGFNPAVNFCHFSTLLTFSHFNFSQVRHQLHRSLIYILLQLNKKLIEFWEAWMLLFCDKLKLKHMDIPPPPHTHTLTSHSW